MIPNHIVSKHKHSLLKAIETASVQEKTYSCKTQVHVFSMKGTFVKKGLHRSLLVYTREGDSNPLFQVRRGTPQLLQKDTQNADAHYGMVCVEEDICILYQYFDTPVPSAIGFRYLNAVHCNYTTVYLLPLAVFYNNTK